MSRHPAPIIWHDSVASTMTEAARLAAEGYPSGTVVAADEQTAGQGRHGHTWHSERGGLYISMILRVNLLPASLTVLTVALGLATAEAVTRVTGLHPDLRWPNDVLLDGKKVAGILVQLVDNVAIAGIGVNVNHTAFPPDLANEATSLRLVAGRPQSRDDLLSELVSAVDNYSNMLADRGRAPILDLFSHQSSYVNGRRVRVEQSGAMLEGVTAGLDDSGFLILRADDGRETTILAGGVRPA
jgi:BirA family transcriptional regulator, biotin operon repressor / biotin---[acetyl-CoA-carboxylase] ligase